MVEGQYQLLESLQGQKRKHRSVKMRISYELEQLIRQKQKELEDVMEENITLVLTSKIMAREIKILLQSNMIDKKRKKEMHWDFNLF